MHRILLTATLTAVMGSAQIPDFKPPTPLFGAVLRNDVQAAKQILEAGADPNEGRFFGSPALLYAVINANTDMTRELIARGADPKATDRHGSTTLMWAVGNEQPNAALIEEFLKRGVDPNAQNSLGETALTWATRRGNMRVIERLKAAGATDSQTIRKSVESAVALLQKSGPQFVKVSGCVSCHHQSVPQMAYAAARERGFAVDATVSQQQVTAVMAMFKPIREGMEKGTAVLPNPGISVSYSLLGLAAEGYAPDETTRAMAAAISRTQLPDGSFAVLPARPPMEANAFTATALSIRALQVYDEYTSGKIAKAREWLLQAKPATQEERNMHLMGLAWSNASRVAIDRAAAAVLAEQRPDGGWAQLSGLETDAYATGQALAALSEAQAITPNAQAYQKAVAYLLRTQLPDGSWHVRTRSSPVQPLKDSGFPHGRDQWISAAATGWAAMALACTQPKATSTMTEGEF